MAPKVSKVSVWSLVAMFGPIGYLVLNTNVPMYRSWKVYILYKLKQNCLEWNSTHFIAHYLSTNMERYNWSYVSCGFLSQSSHGIHTHEPMVHQPNCPYEALSLCVNDEWLRCRGLSRMLVPDWASIAQQNPIKMKMMNCIMEVLKETMNGFEKIYWRLMIGIPRQPPLMVISEM